MLYEIFLHFFSVGRKISFLGNLKSFWHLFKATKAPHLTQKGRENKPCFIVLTVALLHPHKTQDPTETHQGIIIVVQI